MPRRRGNFAQKPVEGKVLRANLAGSNHRIGLTVRQRMRVLDEWPGTGRSSDRATSQNWMRPQMRTLLSLSASGAYAGAGAPRRAFSRLPNVGVRPAIAVSVSVWIVGVAIGVRAAKRVES